MQKKCSHKVVSCMIVLQIAILTLVLSQIPDFNMFDFSNVSYVVGLFVVLFAIGFFAFSFKSCCHKDTSHSKCCSENPIPKH